jgi:integrase/recombinase XerC
LQTFSRFTGQPVEESIGGLMGNGAGHANMLVMSHKAWLMDQSLAPATVNLRLSALRAIVDLARLLGKIEWSLTVKGLKVEPYRDTRGPSLDEMDRIAQAAKLNTRDYAIVRLAFCLGLRRMEICRLDLSDLDFENARVWVLRKRHSQKISLTLPDEVQAALKSWLEQRGTAPGPLFCRQDHAGNGNGRLTGQAVRLIIGRISQAAIGRRVKPHGLRHASITAALDLTNGNIRTVQSFSGHADPQTVMKYDDNRLDLAGDVAKRLSRLIS